jgi:hypothetical protein
MKVQKFSSSSQQFCSSGPLMLCPNNRRVATAYFLAPIKQWRRWHTTTRWYSVEPRRRGGPKGTPPRGVGSKYPVCFVIGSCGLIIQSQLNPRPRIRNISDPSQSRPLLGQAPRVWRSIKYLHPSEKKQPQFTRIKFGNRSRAKKHHKSEK